MDRSVPFDLQAERASLGSILLDRDAIVVVAAWLPAEYFYLEKHALIYEAMLACYNRREPPDLATVAAELRRQERLDLVGGLAFLGELAAEVPTAVHIEYYARNVERTAVLRRLIEAGGKISAMGYDESVDLESTLDKAESELFGVSQRRSTQDFVPIGQIVNQLFTQIESLQERRGEVAGVATGYTDLDELTGGLQPSDLIILAARPSVGKTSLALSLAYNVAFLANATVGVFSLEMSRDQLVQRILAMHTSIDMQRLRTGNLRADELNLAFEGMGVLSELPIYIEDTPGLSITEVRAKARRLHAEAGVDLLMIDYLQLMSGRRSDNRVQEVSEISRGLKALARELNVPVIALSQLSRAVEGRQSHVPMLSDLRESGCLAGESLVYMPDQGVYRRIDELVGKTGFNVLALNTETWRLEPRPVTNAFCTGVKPVLRLTTRLGRSIRATGNHKFLTIDGWRRLDELAPGQRLAMPRHLPGPAAATMSDDELALLALLIGDGCTLARQPIHFTTADADMAELAAGLATRVFGAAVAPRVSAERSWYQVYLAASARLTHRVRNPVAAWLDEMGVFNLRSYEKRVPERVFAQPDAQIAHFLRHLWATDGCIHLSVGKIKSIKIYYATSSPRLAGEVQSLLLRLGINACILRYEQKGKGKDQYHVKVSGKAEVERFIALVGSIDQKKLRHQELIRACIADSVAKTNRDVIPGLVWEARVLPSLQGKGYSLAQARRLAVGASSGAAVLKQNLSRARAQRIGQILECEELLRLATSDVYWDEIMSIEPDGEAPVYDLTVDEHHNFVSLDIIVKNSIEQDADIVMFIYREELYDRETDKKGIAEIHIAKHRNGPLGIIPLRFEARTTRFQNLERYRAPEGY
jgi:replicative DNA helicase